MLSSSESNNNLPLWRQVSRWLAPVALTTLLSPWSLVAIGDMQGVLGWWLLMFVAPPLGLLIGSASLLYALFRRRISLPIVMTLVLALVVIWPSFWSKGSLAMAYPAFRTTHAPVKVRVPTDVPMRVLWGGNQLKENRHAIYPDQRWAYDLVIEPAGLQSSKLQDYGCFGVTVVAPVDGEIVFAEDDQQDQTPWQSSDTATAWGNYVVLRAEKEAFVIIAHLQQGSLRVQANDRVRAGDPIAACGNSGQSVEPHVHLHVQIDDPRSHPTGFARGRALAFIGYNQPPRGGIKQTKNGILFTGDTIQNVRQR